MKPKSSDNNKGHNYQRLQTKVNTQPSAELVLPSVDLYLQEFFLHVYSIVMEDKDNFFEAKEGNTYIKISQEEQLTSVIMTWFSD